MGAGGIRGYALSAGTDELAVPHVRHSLSQEKEDKMDLEHPEPIHPANAEELANIAEETGAELAQVRAVADD